MCANIFHKLEHIIPFLLIEGKNIELYYICMLFPHYCYLQKIHMFFVIKSPSHIFNILLLVRLLVGGFSFVYIAQDVQTGKEYALKRLIGTNKQACNAIINEINTHKQLSGHPNIVTFIGAAFIDKTTGPQQRAEYLLLTELCNGNDLNLYSVKKLILYFLYKNKGGSLIDCMNVSFDPALVLRIFYQASRAVAHMHIQTPPISHRDIKVLIMLISNFLQILIR